MKSKTIDQIIKKLLRINKMFRLRWSRLRTIANYSLALQVAIDLKQHGHAQTTSAEVVLFFLKHGVNVKLSTPALFRMQTWNATA